MRLRNCLFYLSLGFALLMSTRLAAQDNTAMPENVSIAEKPQRRIGLAIPGCSVKRKTLGESGRCSGSRIDYVSTWDVVIATEYLKVEFSDFLKSYALSSTLLGYRFDFDFWIRLFGGESIPYLSSLYLTLLPIELTHAETIKTQDYDIIYRQGPPFRLELGWKINDHWDAFVYGYRSEHGPFLVKTENGVVKDRLTVIALFFGAHYAF